MAHARYLTLVVVMGKLLARLRQNMGACKHAF